MRNSNIKQLASLVIAVVGIALLSSCSADKAQDFTASTHDGTTFTLSSCQGRQGVVLVFFASWCAACAEQVPSIKELAANIDGSKVAVYGISIQEDADTIAAYVQERQIPYPILLDPDAAVAKQFDVQGIPTFIGVDVGGRVVYRGHVLPEERKAFLATLTG